MHRLLTVLVALTIASATTILGTNANVPARLPTAPFLALVAGFVVGAIAVALVWHRRFSRRR